MPSSRGFPLWVSNWVGFGSTWVSGQVICSGHIANNFSRQYIPNNVFKPNLVSSALRTSVVKLVYFAPRFHLTIEVSEFYKHTLQDQRLFWWLHWGGGGWAITKTEKKKHISCKPSHAKKTYMYRTNRKKKYRTTWHWKEIVPTSLH